MSKTCAVTLTLLSGSTACYTFRMYPKSHHFSQRPHLLLHPSHCHLSNGLLPFSFSLASFFLPRTARENLLKHGIKSPCAWSLPVAFHFAGSKNWSLHNGLPDPSDLAPCYPVLSSLSLPLAPSPTPPLSPSSPPLPPFSHCSPSHSLFWSHWLTCLSWKEGSIFPPQSLCTCCFLSDVLQGHFSIQFKCHLIRGALKFYEV